jgi:Bacterial SH3 domain
VKRFVLFLLFVGAAVYLLTPPRTPPERPTESVSAAQTQADAQVSGPLNSWGSSLQSLRQEPDVEWASEQQADSPEVVGSVPRRYTDKKGSQPKPDAPPSVRADQASTPTKDDAEQEAVEWVKMTQAVRLRSKASVSSPGLQLYPTGSKAQVVERKNGWVLLLDPTTQERGWVYHRYLASIDGPSAAQPVAASKPPVKVASSRSRKPTRTKPAVRTSDTIQMTEAQRRRDRRAWRAERGPLFGLFKRREAKRAWSLGPAR